MKIRSNHTSIYFYLQRLVRDGYKKTGVERKRGRTKLILEKADSPAILVIYSENGWLSVTSIN